MTMVKVGDHVIRDYDGRTGTVNYAGRDVFQVWWDGDQAVDPLHYPHNRVVTPPAGGPHTLITDTGVTVELARRND